MFYYMLKVFPGANSSVQPVSLGELHVHNWEGYGNDFMNKSQKQFWDLSFTFAQNDLCYITNQPQQRGFNSDLQHTKTHSIVSVNLSSSAKQQKQAPASDK